MDFLSLADAIDPLTHQIQSLSWDDLPSKLEPNEEQAHHAPSLVLIGCLVAKKSPKQTVPTQNHSKSLGFHL